MVADLRQAGRKSTALTLLVEVFFLILGSGLQCYRCLDPVSYCNSTTTCSLLFDTCAIVVAGKRPRIYHLCWKYTDCNFEFFSKKLEEKELEYRCCQSDLCNHELKATEKEKEKGGTVTLSGKTLLPVMLVLVTSWNSFP
uniref:CD59 glycoprotein n=1 Tax=Sciurus vulgaris TaxID=55149 RepID=A0A8D2ATC1_SCIVU